MTRAQQPQRVFLNIPYDPKYERLFVAEIAGLVCLGRQPECALTVPNTGPRLQRIMERLRSCDVSIHDLSRVEGRPPRFNMPFELGIACALHGSQNGPVYFVFEGVRHRILRSLSDLNGYDPLVHQNRQEGVLNALRDCFATAGGNPSIEGMRLVTRRLSRAVTSLKRRHRVDSIYSRDLYLQTVTAAVEIARDLDLLET